MIDESEYEGRILTPHGLYDVITDVICDVQKMYVKTDGLHKKVVVLEVIRSIINKSPYKTALNGFTDNYLEDMIDFIISLSRNKKVIKTLKKSCKCLK